VLALTVRRCPIGGRVERALQCGLGRRPSPGL